MLKEERQTKLLGDLNGPMKGDKRTQERLEKVIAEIDDIKAQMAQLQGQAQANQVQSIDQSVISEREQIKQIDSKIKAKNQRIADFKRQLDGSMRGDEVLQIRLNKSIDEVESLSTQKENLIQNIFGNKMSGWYEMSAQ